MKFSVCVDAVFWGKDVYESIELLAKSGLKNIEFWTWWDKDLDRLLELKEKWGITYTAFCSKFVSLVDPAARDEYVQGFRETCEAAKKLGCRNIITKPLDKTQASFEEQYQVMKETLQICTKIAEEYDVTIVIEPVNSAYEAPNTFMDNSTLGFSFVDDIHNDHLKVLYDIYHMQIDEGNVLKRILENLPKIGHIHTAGSRERHELKDGELNYDFIFQKLEEAGYDGYVGLEYFPAQDPIEGLLEVTKKSYRPLIDLNGVLHIALVVRDVNEAAAEWSRWTGIPVDQMNMRLKGITKGQDKDPRSHYRGDYSYGLSEGNGFWEADVDLPNGLRIELIQPEPEQGPFREYYDKHGTGIHHIAFRCGEDCEALNDALEAAGYPYIVDTYHLNLDRWPVHDTEDVMGTNLCIKPGKKNG